jgi:hypothetical protein
MAEKIEVKVSKQIRIEAVEGGLFFLSVGSPDGKTYGERTAATSAASLVKQINTLLGLEKKARKSRTPKAPAAQ